MKTFTETEQKSLEWYKLAREGHFTGMHVSECGRFAVCREFIKSSYWELLEFDGKTEEDLCNIYCWKPIKSRFFSMREAQSFAAKKGETR